MTLVADNADTKKHYVDNGWPEVGPDDHAVSELVSDRTGSLSPFGDIVFPLPASEIPYVHPVTVVNR
jgi:hypothetical protein